MVVITKLISYHMGLTLLKPPHGGYEG